MCGRLRCSVSAGAHIYRWEEERGKTRSGGGVGTGGMEGAEVVVKGHTIGYARHTTTGHLVHQM